ncbi:hypothetical protein CHH28_11605 [Bacterioplanes sanyensis]|uniref:DUF4397 domain-containing protein n=1 Tax=Bacterioplanes sanyensis TaxID=1249553 RepID=A0A222FKU6_9GAMM|nr:DUF4397 domain-containing protein [Bacterioplanes sanyensis]ASP39282.1 hypothetical protein CHH28_11605 [Bacterioplanes sanyensis]
MMKVSQLIAVSAVSLGLVACGSDDDDKDYSYVRVLHASADAPAVDVLIDGKAVLENVSFQQGSDYLRVNAGPRDVALRVAGTDTIALQASLTLAENGRYSVIAQNQVASLELEVLDDTSRFNNGTTDVTVVHAAPAAGAVDVYVTAAGADLGQATLSAVPFDANASLAEIASGDYQVRLTGAGASDVVYDSGSLAISTDVTAVAVASMKGASPVTLLAWSSSVTPVLDNSAEVRIVHAVDAADVDIYAGGNKLLDDFSFTNTTDGYVKVAAGNLDVAITGADSTLQDAFSNLSGTLMLERGESYTVIAAGDTGALAQARLITLMDKRMNASSTDGDIRLVHASSAAAADPVDIYVYGQGMAQPAEPTFADVTLGQDTGYTALPAGTYTVDIAADGTTAPAIPGTDAIAISAGSISTAIAVGNGSGLSAILLNDKR